MLNLSPREQVSEIARPADKEFETAGIDVERLLRAGRRQIWVLSFFCLASLGIGAAYLSYVVPRYTATAVVLIGSAKDKTGLSASIADLTYDAGAIDSQLEILKSEGIAQTVVSKLKLESVENIGKAQPSLIGRIIDGLRSALHLERQSDSDRPEIPQDPADKQHALIDQLTASLDVRRIGRSYVIDIDYTSPDRVTAAERANAFAAAYIDDQLDARSDATHRTSSSLEKRIPDLRRKSLDSDLAVQKFKAERGLLTADGHLVSDQQLSELSTQLILAQSERAKAEARYGQISDMIVKKDVNGVVLATLESSLITELRQKYLAATQMELDAAKTLGPNAAQVVNLQHTTDDYIRLIFDEMTRIAAAYRSEAEVARAKELSLRQSMATLVGQNDARAQAMVDARELQREADSDRKLYTTYLERLQQVQEGQTLPESEARVITPATPPMFPTYPKKTVVMALSLTCGLLVGVGVGALREYLDNVFRTAADVTEGLNYELLGMLPTVKARKGMSRLTGSEPDAGYVDDRNPVLGYAIANPLASFAETLRTMKVAIDLRVGQQSTKVVGVISVLPDEGKSTVSKNFASLMAHLGQRVLLIDGDLHHPGLTRVLAGHAQKGLLEVLRGDVPLEEAILYEPASGLFFLPAVIRERLHHAGQELSSAGMRTLLATASESFDYIVIDLPPIGPVVDVRAAAGMFDGFVLVVRWGKTVRDMVQTMLASDNDIASRCVGVVYNRVDFGRIKLYEGSGAKAFHHRAFGKYYSA